jgi:hypothetical protein
VQLEMKKKIYLHIGPHRTATTSSQIMFAEMAVPANTAFYYPSTGRSTNASQYGHNLVFPDIFFGKDPLFSQLISEIDNCNNDKVLLSAENFYSIDPLILKSSFAEYEVKIIYTKRNFFDWVISIIAFNVMHGLRLNLLEFFRNAVVSNVHDTTSSVPYMELDFFNWRSRFTRWNEAFGSENIACSQFGVKYPYLDILTALCDPAEIDLISQIELKINQSPTILGLLQTFESDGTRYKIRPIPEAEWLQMAEEFSAFVGEDFPANSLFCYKLLSIDFEMSIDEMTDRSRRRDAPIIKTHR